MDRESKFENIAFRFTQIGRMQLPFVLLYHAIFYPFGFDEKTCWIYGMILGFGLLIIGEIVAFSICLYLECYCNMSANKKHEYANHHYINRGLISDDEPERFLACKHCKHIKQWK